MDRPCRRDARYCREHHLQPFSWRHDEDDFSIHRQRADWDEVVHNGRGVGGAGRRDSLRDCDDVDGDFLSFEPQTPDFDAARGNFWDRLRRRGVRGHELHRAAADGGVALNESDKSRVSGVLALLFCIGMTIALLMRKFAPP